MTFNAYQMRSCPSCGSVDSQVQLTAGDFMLGLEGEFYISRCVSCGLLYQNPSLRPEFLGKHYPDDYGPYSAGELHIGKSLLWYLKNRQGYAHLDVPHSKFFLKRQWGKLPSLKKLLPDYVPNGRLLEIACASGNRLSMLHKLGWKDCQGIEFNAASAKTAQARGFTVQTGRVEEAIEGIPDQSQDVILAGFVLEHLENPFQISDRIADKLSPGGQFLFSTLNIESPDFQMYREFWYDLDLPRHHTFFRKQDLFRMLKGRFIVKGISYIPAPNDYIGSARYRQKYQRRLIDKVIIKLGKRIYPLCVCLGFLGKASRICMHTCKI